MPQEADYNEIDIVEIVGWLGSDIITSNMYWPDNPTNPIKIIDFDSIGIQSDYSDTFITYGVLWRTDSIIYYINHIRSAALKNNGQLNDQRIVFNFSLNEDTTTGIVLYPEDSLKCPDTMLVDYVRVYDYNPDTTYTKNKQKHPYVINSSYYNGGTYAQAGVMWQLNDTTFNQSNGYCRIKQFYGNNYSSYTQITKQITSDHLYKQILYGMCGTEQKYLVEVLGSNGQPLANQPFPDTCSFYYLPARNSKNAKFYVYGDTRGFSNGNHPPHHNAVCGAILNEIDADPGSNTVLLHAGDWNSSDSEFDWDKEYFNENDQNAIKLRSKISIFGVKGNHESYMDINGNWREGENFRKYFPFRY
jgi:hypothetical protein